MDPSLRPLERSVAFLSYSSFDSDFAGWLHKRLEAYAVPKTLVGRPCRNGNIASRIGKVVRDRTDFAAGDLQREVRAALETSDYLIVVCSPNSAKSDYVNREIRCFKQLGKGDAILLAILSGEPHAATKPGHHPEEECFPMSLAFQTDDAGELTTVPEQIEPLAADFRPDKDGRENGFLKLVAGVLGVGLDELIERERQAEKKRRRRAYKIATAMAFLALAALAGAAFAWWARNLAANREKEAQHARDQAIAAQHHAEAQSRLAVGRSLALTATSIAKENPSSMDLVNALVIEAFNRLPSSEANTLAASLALQLAQLIPWRSGSNETGDVAFFPGNHVLAMIEFATGLHIVDIDRNHTRVIPATRLGAEAIGGNGISAPLNHFSSIQSGSYLIIQAFDGHDYVLNTRTLEVSRVDVDERSIEFSPDFTWLATITHFPRRPAGLNFYSLPKFEHSEVKLSGDDALQTNLDYVGRGFALLPHSRGFRVVKSSGNTHDYDLPPGWVLAGITGDGTSVWIAAFPLTTEVPPVPNTTADWILPPRAGPGVYRFDPQSGRTTPVLLLSYPDFISLDVEARDRPLLIRAEDVLHIQYPSGVRPGRTVRLTGNAKCRFCTDVVIAGQWFASEADAGWDVVNLDNEQTWFFPQEKPRTVMFARSGARALFLNQTEIAIADLDSGTILSSLQEQVELGKVAISDAGDLIAFGVEGGSKVARLDPVQLKSYLCSQPGHNLTAAEWSRYVGDEPRTATCPSWK